MAVTETQRNQRFGHVTKTNNNNHLTLLFCSVLSVALVSAWCEHHHQIMLLASHGSQGEQLPVGSARSRRAIVTFTAEQRDALEDFFLTWSGDLNADEKKQLVALSERIGLSKHQIRGWLRNRRIRGTYKGKITHDVEQVRALEWLYNNYSRYPSSKFNHELAVIVGMTYPQVKKVSFCFFLFVLFFFSLSPPLLTLYFFSSGFKLEDKEGPQLSSSAQTPKTLSNGKKPKTNSKT